MLFKDDILVVKMNISFCQLCCTYGAFRMRSAAHPSGWWKTVEEAHCLGWQYFCYLLYISPWNIQFPGFCCTVCCTGMKEDRIFVPGSCNQLDLLTSIFFHYKLQLTGVRVFSSYRDWSYFVQSENFLLLCYILCEINKWSISVITIVRC